MSGAATDAKFTLNHGDGAVTDVNFTADQSTGAGAWNTLGKVTLSKGEKVTVALAASGTGTVVADAVRLVRDNAADTDAEDKAFAYGYDLNGNLTDITDTSRGTAKNADAYAMAYDGLNQIKSVREDLAGSPAATTSYTYNNLGAPLTVTHPDQASEYVYNDPRNLLTKVTVDDLNDTKAGKVTSYTYDVLGRQKTVTKGNGNVTTNVFQSDGALKSMREETSAGALVASHAYTYDANGNQLEDVASKKNADAEGTLDSTTTYVYDPVDRLKGKTKTGHAASTETYVHDANANVIQQTVGGTSTSFNYDRNRLLSSTVDGQTASYRYDPFGRQTSVVGGGKTISRTTYDGFDHIKVAEQANDAGVLEATTYTYDPLDRTASKTTSGTDGKKTDYTYLGLSQEVLGEEVAGELTKSYQYSPWGQRLSQVTHQADTEAGVEAGETGYYGYNAHTDVETVTDDTGDTVATYGYTAYGDNDDAEFTGIDKPEAGNPEQPGDESFNAYRFNGKRWDAGSGTYDMGFRDYAPGLNTFTTRDMYNGALADMGLGADPFTGNRYAFTAGNPISGIEIDGHDWSWSEFAIEAVGGAGNAALDGLVEAAEFVGDGIDCAQGDCSSMQDRGEAAVEGAKDTAQALSKPGAGRPMVKDAVSWTKGLKSTWDSGKEEQAVAEGALGVAGAAIQLLGMKGLGSVKTAAISCMRSFSGDTLVLMGDGSKKPIKDVKIGDLVIATNPITGLNGPRVVTALWIHLDALFDVEINGYKITTTEDHPFWSVTDQRWEDTQDLGRNELVLTEDGRRLPVTKPVDLDQRLAGRAYNLTVDDLHTYAVGVDEILVHNTNCPVYRTQTSHPDSQRLGVDADGNITLSGDGRLYLNMSGDSSHSLQFRGADGEVIGFDVDSAFVNRVQELALPQRKPRGFSGSARDWNKLRKTRPDIADPSVSPGLYGIPSSMFDDLMGAIVPGSGRVVQ